MNGREIEPGIWHWEEDYRVYCTLVQGERLAILWDTGQGKQDLSAWVAAQVSTPCIVCNSHGHSDHIGGNFRFPLVYAHPADWPLLAAQANPEEYKDLIVRVAGYSDHFRNLSKELQDEIINRTEQSFDDYSDADSEYPKGGCGC